MEKNCFYHASLFPTQYDKSYAKRRIQDFEKLLKILKPHLIPKHSVHILEDKMKEYINAHQPENRPLVEDLLKKVLCIPFKEFHQSLMNQAKRFSENNKEPYVLVIGANFNIEDMANIYKSNFWTMLLAYPHIPKPIDIVFNLTLAVQMYYPDIKNFVVIDDCAYSGSQLYVGMKDANIELRGKGLEHNMGNEIHKLNVVKVLNEDKLCNIHLIIPYISTIAYRRFLTYTFPLGFEVILYFENVIKQYNMLFAPDIFRKLSLLYLNCSQYLNEKYNVPIFELGSLVPVIFQHKIADLVSTIGIVITDGTVLDNPDIQIRFIEECMDDNKEVHFQSMTPNSCPILSPYKKFANILFGVYYKSDDTEDDFLI